MSLADLKLACAAQGLPKTGTKAKLINFLEHPELYAKPAKKQKTVAPAPADKPLAKPPAKPLVDRAARPTRATVMAARASRISKARGARKKGGAPKRDLEAMAARAEKLRAAESDGNVLADEPGA